MSSISVWLVSLCVGCLVVSLHAVDLSSTDHIAATATVINPLGLMELQESADSLGMPVLTQLGTRSFLFIPRGKPIILLNGEPLQIEPSENGDVISMLDLTELLAARKGNSPLTLTVISADN